MAGEFTAYLSETDKVNNLVKLIRSRLASRALASNPEIVQFAVIALDEVIQMWGWVPAHDEWRELLGRPTSEIRRELTARNQRMDRLRIDSPFFRLSQHGLDFTDESERRRIWWIARRLAGISKRDELWTRDAKYESQRQLFWNMHRKGPKAAGSLSKTIDRTYELTQTT